MRQIEIETAQHLNCNQVNKWHEKKAAFKKLPFIYLTKHVYKEHNNGNINYIDKKSADNRYN